MMTLTDEQRLEVYRCMDAAIDALVAKGVSVPASLRRRDKREPGRKEKEYHEDKLYAIMRRRWKRQTDKIRTHLERYHPDRKAIPDLWIDDDRLWDEPDSERELVLLLIAAIRGGVRLFADSIRIGLDYSMTNAEAAAWVRKYAFDLIQGVDNTSREAVRRAVGAFVETAGMTIRDVMDLLPFDEGRAMRIATTEITRAYAMANEIAGKELAKEYPGVRVVKTWYTNNDDRVCDICGPLDGMEVEIGEGFTTAEDKSEGIPEPPAHVGCRCWIATATRVER